MGRLKTNVNEHYPKKHDSKKHGYQTILFDLDGTVTEPGTGITNAVMYALEKYKIPVTDRTELYRFIGPPLRDSFRDFYGFSDEQAEEAVRYYREYYGKTGLFENEVYDGMDTLLAALKSAGFTVAMATSKPQEYSERILKHFDLDRYFDFVAGATMDGSRSKKGDVIAYALDSLGVTDRTQVLMVGDRRQDILGAKENHLDALGVLYGYGDRAELSEAGADYIAETVRELEKFLLGI